MVRGKFLLIEIGERHYSPTGRAMKFSAQYDQSIEEDRKYSKATPTGSVEMFVDNPAALAQFEIGKAYYFDVTPAEG